MKDRFTGVLLGMACGEQGPRPPTGPAPAWGAETALAVELAEAVGEVGAYHAEAALEKYGAWAREARAEPAKETAMPVRSVPIALVAIADDDRILSDTLVDTRLTHRRPEAGYAAAALTLLVARFAFGERDRDAALRQVAELLQAEAPDLAAFLGHSAGTGAPASEAVPAPLAAGLAAFLRGETLEAALSVGDGGPGAGAVAGALAGAWFGEWGIPAARRARLRDPDRIAAAAEGLFRVVRLGSPWTER